MSERSCLNRLHDETNTNPLDSTNGGLKTSCFADLSDLPPDVSPSGLTRRSVSWPLSHDQADTILQGVDISVPLTSPFDASLGSSERAWVRTSHPGSAADPPL